MPAAPADRRFVLTLSCPDRPGLVAGVATFLASFDGWILEAAHHSDAVTGRFFMRQEVRADSVPFGLTELRGRFAEVAAKFEMTWAIHDTAEPPRTVFLCSKQDHCIVDLLHRWRTNDLPCELVAVVSNHDDLRSFVEWHDVPYHHIPVPPGSREDKQPAFDAVRKLCRELDADTLVLARYMQIVPPDFCDAWPNRILNIHHSFLPSFVGGKPYHQAYDRGVKLVGATCHYVTPDLDAGPIIEQDVVRVNHADTVDDMVRRGRDVERRVLATGVRLHLEHRVLVHGNKTVVFP
ncbi:MAG: formyltetrahydrofolate deformylase [Planctomycetota bacterium]